MKLGLRISKTAWEKLTPAVQELYSSDGDDYALQVEDNQGTDEIGPLKRALDRTRADLNAERDARKAAEGKLDDLDTNDARKRGDIEKLTKQWETKLEVADAASKDAIGKMQNHIRETTIDAIVAGVAGRNTSSKENAALLDPHIRQKLSVEFGDDGPSVMMNIDGAKAPLDADKFEKTVVDNPAFAAIIVGNRASGGGAPENNSKGQTGGAFPTDNQGQQSGPVDLSTVDPKELVRMLPKS